MENQQAAVVRNLVIGDGIPKVCVPMVGATLGILEEEAEQIRKKSPDLVEWRGDFFQDIDREDKVREALEKLGPILEDIPLLFTFRTKREGGNREISRKEYEKLNLLTANTKYVDIVDVECFPDLEMSNQLIAALHKAGVKVMGSHHNFQETPQKEEIIQRLLQIQDTGADILKLAAMPKKEEDLLTLLQATQEMKRLGTRPVVTMSMGAMGALSRICGSVFGSSITFGSVSGASAPGQIPIDELRSMLANIQRYCR